jgi:hypothetical protein
MKLLPLSLLLTGIAVPVLAETGLYSHTEQQMCMTWLSLASINASPESEREPYEKAYLRLEKSVSARTDLDPADAKKQADEAIAVWNKWTMDYGMSSNAEERVRLIVEAMDKARSCLHMVPSEDDRMPGATDAPQGDGTGAIDIPPPG